MRIVSPQFTLTRTEAVLLARGDHRVKVDEYRANVEFCERMAGRATRGDETAAWQQLAQSWRILVTGEERLIASRSGLSHGLMPFASRPSKTPVAAIAEFARE
jgi:hypothetical protein